MLFVDQNPQDLTLALQAWEWLPVEGKKAVRVTPFGDIFLLDAAGIHFLDTVTGTLDWVCASEAGLDAILTTEEGREEFLLEHLVVQAGLKGLRPSAGFCLNFCVDPVVGGPLDISNVQICRFTDGVRAAGIIHEQVKDVSVGTSLSSVSREEGD